MNSNWHNVTKSEPCPICGKGDWCNRLNDGDVVICHRVESPRPARGGGWIHRLKDLAETATARKTLPSRRLGATTFSSSRNFACDAVACVPKLDFARVHASYDGDDVLLDGLALELGVEVRALKALDVRYNHMDGCWSFPMRNAKGEIVGLRYRELGGSKKWSARGSKDGLFFDPTILQLRTSTSTNLYITEGASDTAAALSLGWLAVGRSSCTSGTELIKELLHHFTLYTLTSTLSVTIVSDNDAPGLAGARALATALGGARVVTPPAPYKDLRAAVTSDSSGVRPSQTLLLFVQIL